MSIFSSCLRRYVAILLTVLGVGYSNIALTSNPLPVEVVRAQERPVEYNIQLTGTVAAARSASLSTSIAGLVTGLNVDVGNQVNKGDLLLELDAELAKWQWQGAKATLRASNLALSDAKRRLSEVRALAPKQSIAETVVLNLAAEVAEDEAALQRTQADERYRKTVFDRHLLKAPFAGVISVKQTELGEWVSPGQAVLQLVATNDLHIDFQVSEDYLSAVGPDTKVTYTLGDSPRRYQQGEVDFFVPIADPDSRTFLLRVTPEQGGQIANPGMSARAILHLGNGRKAIAIPRDAVIKFPDGRVAVWVVEGGEAGDIATQRTVDTGLVFNGLVEIRDGLAVDDRVITLGNETLRTGQHVLVLNSK